MHILNGIRGAYALKFDEVVVWTLMLEFSMFHVSSHTLSYAVLDIQCTLVKNQLYE